MTVLCRRCRGEGRVIRASGDIAKCGQCRGEGLTFVIGVHVHMQPGRVDGTRRKPHTATRQLVSA